MEQLEAGLEHVLAAPKENGEVSLICRRPETLERELLEQAELTVEDGMAGDNWKARSMAKGRLEILRQLTLMNWRCISLIAPDESRRPLAGDQLYVDFDLSDANVPAGSFLRIGDAIIEVTEPPHTGCRKFVERFGMDAMKFVNDERGRAHNLRGVNARVIKPGRVQKGDRITKVAGI